MAPIIESSAATTSSPINNKNKYNSLKRNRPLDVNPDCRAQASFKRRCVADDDNSESSCSSGEEEDFGVSHSSMQQNSSLPSTFLSNPSALKIRRAMSLNATAPAAFFSPPSPPHLHHAFEDLEKHNGSAAQHALLQACYSNSEDENNAVAADAAACISTPRKTHARHRSVSVATLRRHRTMGNPDTRTGSFMGNDAAALCLGSRKRRSPGVPRCDLTARARCFDYLVSAIDEVWAQYCAYTSCAEDEMYAVDGDEKRNKTPKHRRTTSVYSDHELPNSPASLCEEDGNYSSTNESYGPRTPFHESRYNSPRQMYSCNTSSRIIFDDYNDNHDDSISHDDEFGQQSAVSDKSLAPSEQPGSVRLLQLKQRLMKAKYYLQDLVDRDDIDSSAAFWNKWDLVKYPAIELVEDDGDDDDTVETVTEELEDGRHYANVY